MLHHHIDPGALRQPPPNLHPLAPASPHPPTPVGAIAQVNHKMRTMTMKVRVKMKTTARVKGKMMARTMKARANTTCKITSQLPTTSQPPTTTQPNQEATNNKQNTNDEQDDQAKAGANANNEQDAQTKASTNANTTKLKLKPKAKATANHCPDGKKAIMNETGASSLLPLSFCTLPPLLSGWWITHHYPDLQTSS